MPLTFSLPTHTYSHRQQGIAALINAHNHPPHALAPTTPRSASTFIVYILPAPLSATTVRKAVSLGCSLVLPLAIALSQAHHNSRLIITASPCSLSSLFHHRSLPTFLSKPASHLEKAISVQIQHCRFLPLRDISPQSWLLLPHSQFIFNFGVSQGFASSVELSRDLPLRCHCQQWLGLQRWSILG